MSGRAGMGNSELFSLPPEILRLPEARAQGPPLPYSFLTVFSAFLVPLAPRCLAELQRAPGEGRANVSSHNSLSLPSGTLLFILNLPHITLNVVVRQLVNNHKKLYFLGTFSACSIL